MRVTIGLAIIELAHEPGRCIAEMQGHLQTARGLGIGAGGLIGQIDGIALGRAGQINQGLRHGQFAFGTAETFLHRPGVEGQFQAARVGVADVLAGDADDAPRQIEGIDPAIQHAAEPVQRRIRRAPTHRFVQRGNLIVEILALLIETPYPAARQDLPGQIMGDLGLPRLQ